MNYIRNDDEDFTRQTCDAADDFKQHLREMHDLLNDEGVEAILSEIDSNNEFECDLRNHLANHDYSDTVSL